MGGIGSGRKPKSLVPALLGAVAKDPSAGRLAKVLSEASAAGTLQATFEREAGRSALTKTPGWRRTALVALTLLGLSSQEVAAIMGTSAGSVRQQLFLLRKAGRVSDTECRLDHAIVPAAIEQLAQLVEAGDKDAVLGVLKGRGHLRSGNDKGGAAPAMAQLNVQFTMPEGTVRPVLQGQVVGVGRSDDE